MSLINKMLQDLDARGAQAGATPQDNVWHGPRRAPRMAWRAIALGVLAVVVLGLLVLFALPFLRRPAAPVAPPPALVQGKAAKPNVVVFASAPSASPSAPAPVSAPATPVSAPATPVGAASAKAPEEAPAVATRASTPGAPALPVDAPSSVGLAPRSTAAAPSVPAALDGVAVAAAVRQEQSSARHAQETTADSTGKSAQHKAAQPSRKIAPDAGLATAAGGAGAAGATSLTGREMTPAQRAENDYRRALDGLQEGRLAEAMASLQQALVTYPRHQAARETLIRLLLENNRQDEAMRQMELGLGLDANQPALAMVLARLQVEKGGPAVETMMRTLPFATANGEYQAFLAALLQRAQRNREAAEHYQLALRGAPQNGVWWMGLGISLQADEHPQEARDAYMRAKATGTLTPELQVFVERRLQQLGQ